MITESKWISPLELKFVVEKVNELTWVLMERGTYASKLAQQYFTIPNGFRTDLASSPTFMHWVIPPDGEYAWEACLHDYLYRTPLVPVTRKMADKIFYEALLCEAGKVGKVKAYLMYKAVCIFGSKSYRPRAVSKK